MSKANRKLGQSLTTKDWMKYRPYDTFLGYDGYYLKLAKSVFVYLNAPQRQFRELLNREDLKEMAILLTCHFEDFISNIGLWDAFRGKNKELYGRFLPFYELEDYDPDYLNPEDFAYLLWHHLGKLGRKTINPYGAAILEAADYCYQFFEQRIDQAPATDFYVEWLELSANMDFFAVKLRLVWLATSNYLIAPAFNRELQKQIKEYFEEATEMSRQIDPGIMIYGIREDFLLKERSAWCALNVPEWLAEVARCSDGLREDIRRLSQRVRGTFLHHEYDDQYYQVEFITSGRKFAVCRESVSINVSELELGRVVAYFGIVRWQNKWWLSGSYMQWPSTDMDLDELRFDRDYVSFYGWEEAQQQQLREMAQDMEAAFLSYFGKRLVFFETDKALAKALQAHHDWWNEEKAKKGKPSELTSRYLEKFKEKPSGFDKLDLGNAKAAAFYSPKQGIMMSGLIPKVVALLEKDVLSTEESHELFYSFFLEFESPLAYYIAEHYSIINLSHPLVLGIPDFIRDHFDFFLRYYNPQGFNEALPNVSLLPG